MKKTGYEIIGMIKDGKAPNKIKIVDTIYELDDGKHYICQVDEDYIYDFDIIEHLNDEFEIIEEDKVWKPSDGEKYYFIDEFNDIDWRIKGSTSLDDFRYNIGNCFKKEEEAKKYLEKKKIYVKLKRYAEEHNEEKIDWKNSKQQKWYIYYETIEKQIKVEGYPWSKHIGQIYFTSEELCEQAIQEIGEDNIKKLFEEE